MRNQLRDTAQDGQADDYGGDRIEDTAVGVAQRAERGAERAIERGAKRGTEKFLGKKANRRDESQNRAPAQENHALEPKSEPEPSAPQAGGASATTTPKDTGKPKIKTREAVTGTPSGHAEVAAPSSEDESPARLSIKTKGAYIQSQPTASSESPPKAFAQGQRELVRKRGRTEEVKQAENRRASNNSAPQVKGGKGEVSSVSARRSDTLPVRRPRHRENPDTQPVREGGKAIVKTGRMVRKASERTARHAIKTAEQSTRKTIKTAQRTVKTVTKMTKTAARTTKTAAQTAKTAQKTVQATVKTAQRAVQAARAAAKAAATTAKAAAKATVAAAKAAVAAVQELAAAIAAGGWVALVVIMVICMVGMLVFSVFGIFFVDERSDPDVVSPSSAMARLDGELDAELSSLQTEGGYDSMVILGRAPGWVDVFAVFATKESGASVTVLDTDGLERLRTVFRDMTKITTMSGAVQHPAEGDTPAWTERVLTVTITPRTPDDMRVFYSFTDRQNAKLNEQLSPQGRAMWRELLFGI